MFLLFVYCYFMYLFHFYQDFGNSSTIESLKAEIFCGFWQFPACNLLFSSHLMSVL